MGKFGQSLGYFWSFCIGCFGQSFYFFSGKKGQPPVCKWPGTPMRCVIVTTRGLCNSCTFWSPLEAYSSHFLLGFRILLSQASHFLFHVNLCSLTNIWALCCSCAFWGSYCHGTRSFLIIMKKIIFFVSGP